jgi:hypothetical protein
MTTTGISTTTTSVSVTRVVSNIIGDDYLPSEGTLLDLLGLAGCLLTVVGGSEGSEGVIDGLRRFRRLVIGWKSRNSLEVTVRATRSRAVVIPGLIDVGVGLLGPIVATGLVALY